MSSTNRSDSRDSHISDYYVTPSKPVEDFLEVFQKDENFEFKSQSHLILDPCAGGDEKHDMTYPNALLYHGADYNKIITNDIREDSPAKYHEDFLIKDVKTHFDIIITNPPFGIAQNIIEKSLEFCKEGGYVIMLLRLNYIGSQGRLPFWRKNKPYAIYSHNKRMSFTDDNKTDSIEYAHFVWKKGENPDHAKFKILQ